MSQSLDSSGSLSAILRFWKCALCRKMSDEALLSYRPSRFVRNLDACGRLHRLGSESPAGQVARGRGRAAPPGDHSIGALTLGRNLREGPLDPVGIDPVSLQVVADGGVAEVALGQRAGLGGGEPLVVQQAGAGEDSHRLGARGGSD